MSKTELALFLLIILNLVLTYSVYKSSEEARINSHNAYQRAILINQDLVKSGLIK